MTTEQALREALERAEMKLNAYVGVCKGDKELVNTVLPMARAALILPPTPTRTEWRLVGANGMDSQVRCSSVEECRLSQNGWGMPMRIESRIVPEPGPWEEVKQ